MRRHKIEMIVSCHSCGLQKKFKSMPKKLVMVYCKGLDCNTVYYAVPLLIPKEAKKNE